MRPLKLFRRYEIEIAFIFATLVLLAAGVSSYRALESAKSSVGWVRHTYQVIGAIDDLVESLVLVHSTGRSFTLTGDTQFRRLNGDAIADANTASLKLNSLTRDNPGQHARLPGIQRLADRIVQRAQTVINTRVNVGPEPAIDLLRSGESARALEEFRRIANDMREREVALLDQREESTNSAFRSTQYWLAGATALALVLVTSAGIGTVRDVRRRKKAERDLFLEKESAQVTLASIGDGVMRADATGKVTFLNRAGTMLTGWTEDEAVGKPLGEIFTVIDATTRKPLLERLQTFADGTVPPLPDTALLVRRDGKEVPIEDTLAPIRDDEGNYTGAVNVFRDVSEAREATRQLRHVAQHDPLTGLPNRVLLYDRIGRAVATADRHAGKVALLYLDLNGFKEVNDTRGHAVGDLLLKSVTARLQACVRDCDTVSRLGGDEFVILLTNVHSSEDVAATVARVMRSLDGAHVVEGADLRVGAAIGVSVYPDDARSTADLLSHADAAMYEAKTKGPGKFVFFNGVHAGAEQRRA